MSLAVALAGLTLAMGWPPSVQGHLQAVDYDPNIYAAAVGTEVTYDNVVADGYDDGYEPDASVPFEAELAPYGTWNDDEKLGRVWVPSPGVVGADFVPYATHGSWVLTEYGWTWESAWAWGWAPFHYGRWAMLNGRRWCWIPGTLWGPAWVSWRVDRTHVGWAALPPRGMRLGRPLGPRSPWRFVRAASLGTASPEPVPPRAVPSVFVHTSVLSKARWITVGTLRVKVPAGPDPASCCGAARRPSALAVAAPGATPHRPIQPRLGTPVETRPWIAAGARDQTPILRWPEPNPS